MKYLSTITSWFQRTKGHHSQNESMLKGRFNDLPDEVIVIILSDPVLDLETLYNMMKISQRIFHLVHHVFVKYRLPALDVVVCIDQEGRNRSTTQFGIQDFNLDKHCITFTPCTPTSRRYYADKQAPAMRFTMITDGYYTPTDTNLTSKRDNAVINRNHAECTEERMMYCKVKMESQSQRLRKINKQGHHYINRTSSLQRSTRWEFGYQISHVVHKEYYLLPLYLEIHLDFLIQLFKMRGE
ncbi:hypothetical protein BCV72DRAFT_335059 [Rhizopus microsporus var. microsporus]|uniref:F-box domain-containing protein n=2 Tax=Rhizopus microsporus TaxID=58291 RepID=A0A2G4SUP1_RHIZD|nr:uncharacterized protein RHIMIDRAFT_282281 [Rhizopus microsporus ATCC 52813]ORE07615.1 hypothetical protein BCV72DRAFT_335059 [Rhizopus microsporus var. microsporus]PHZ12498.1 hypothetical protein RHIMIDRAFT_282281 [Rhizopus microsporus ATCC 52813]